MVNYRIEPHDDVLVFMLECMYSEHTTPEFVNANDRYLIIGKDTVGGEAVETKPATRCSKF